MTAAEIADLAGVSVDRVRPATADEVRMVHQDSTSATVVEVATQEESARYWHAAGEYWLDDPYFGEPVRILDLAYDSELGLHRRDIRGG